MGRALVRKPKIFLFDEPLSNLDAQLRVDMRTEIKKLHQRLGATIVYVTHDQIEAMTLATRIAVMRSGELQQLGTPAEIYNRPEQHFRRRLHGLAAHEPRCRALLRSEGDSAWLEIAAEGRPSRACRRPAARGGAAYEGKEIIAGLRAEAISDDRRRQRRDSPVVEATRRSDRADRPRYAGGARARRPRIHGAAAARHQAEARRHGRFAIDLAKLVWFDPGTARRVRLMDYDVVVIGSGVGGGCVALTLAATGARILILERGERLPREPQNWDAEAVFGDLRYRTRDIW